MGGRPIFYDTETTGVKAEKDFVIEIAAYDPVQDKSFEKLVNPGVPIPKEATAIHGISDDMVAEAPTFNEVGREFVSFCEGDTILIAHNNDGFDIHFLRAEFQRNGIEMPSWRFLDSLKWARRYRPDLPKHSLQFLREIYDFEENNAHRALDDVIMLYQIFTCLTDDLDIEDAYALINKPREIKHMPFGKHQGVPIKKIPANYVKWLAGNGALDKPENEQLKQAFAKEGLLA